jgi:hypothetical protein
LRSSLHPALFAAVYQLAARISTFCGASLSSRADLLLAAPKVAQALSAALLDGYTWKLAEKVYGRGSRTAWTAVRDPTSISPCQSLIFDFAGIIARAVNLQFMAMVLLGTDPFKLP